ncbi:MAG: M13 family metallopeptidase [Peptostreptococcaceae bacterium]|nr:M13 family metallopeptidase [Peptostreptococcaceae bacterium]
MKRRTQMLALLMAWVLLLSSVVYAEEKATPQTDFYSYVNEEWLKQTKIPEGRSSTGNFYQINEKTEQHLHEMIQELRANYAKLKEGSDEKKLIDFYNMAADFKTRDAQKLTPIKHLLDKITSAQSMEQVNQAMVTLYQKNYGTVISLAIDQDIKDNRMNILYVEEPSIGLPKVYLEGKDEFSLKVQKAYKNYLSELLVLNGNSKDEAKRKADAVFNFEKELSTAVLSKEDSSNFESQYNTMTLSELEKISPKLPIVTTIKAMKVDHAKKIVVSQPKAIQKLNSMYHEQNRLAIQAQMELRIIRDNAMYLSKDVIKSVMKFRQSFTGAYRVPSDEEIAFEITTQIFGELMGKVYVKRYFSTNTKQDVLAMVKEIKSAYKKRIENLDWMSGETKAKALKKLETMNVKIGYPDQWSSYKRVKIKTSEQGGTVVSNVEAIIQLSILQSVGQLNLPPNKMQWGMYPQTVNAYYNPINNEIVFPAGILQPPFYDPQASKEENLGGIGAVIGHEISHAFDDSGAQFDEKGNHVNWWKSEDYKKFSSKVQQAADIYSALEVAPGYKVNGKISTGEILADLGGLTVVLDISKEKGYNTKKVFESYGKVWRELKTPEAAIADLSDEHPPGKYRVNNIVNQMDQFYIDFQVKEGDPMYVKPEDRLRVW